MTAAYSTTKGRLIALALLAYAGVFAAFVLVERPGLGIGHFFYLPICLFALAGGAAAGTAGGLVATGLYLAAAELTPHVNAAPLTTSTAIRAATFTGIGMLVGSFAQRNRALVEQLTWQATSDYVTEVGNARAFDDELNRRCESGRPFSLFLVDIDGLKRVNEVHGHGAGDAALRRVADALTTCAAGSFVARVGGDEFAVLTTAGREELPLFTARVNAALDTHALTVTIVATTAPADGSTAVDLFRKADDRLFTAKLVRPRRSALVS